MATGFQTPEFSLEQRRRDLDPAYDAQQRAEEAKKKADEQVQDLLAMGAGYGNNTHSNLAPEGIAEDPLTPDERRDANNRYDKQNRGRLNVPTESPLFSLDLGKAKELAQQQRDIEIVPRFGKWEDMSPAERGEEAYRQVEKEMQENPQARAGVEGTAIVGKDNIPILGSFLSAADASALQVTAQRIVDDKAEPADYILFAKAMHQANHDAQKGLLEQTGEAIADVGTLMVDYWLSGGVLSKGGLGNATEAQIAGKEFAEKAAKKEIFDKALEKIGGGWFKQGAAKVGRHVSDVAIKAGKKGIMYAPRAAETIAGRGSIDDFIIDEKGNYQFKEEEDSAGRDLFEAVATAYAEIVIEEIIPDGVLAGLAKGSKNKAIKKLGEFMTKAGETKVGKAASVGGFGGMLGEIGEERLTELANYVITNEVDQLGTSKALWDAVASGDPEKINEAWEMGAPELGAIGAIGAVKGATSFVGKRNPTKQGNRQNIPASPDAIPGAAGVDDIQDIQVEPGQRQEIAPEEIPDVQVEPTDVTQRAERPQEVEEDAAPPVPRSEVLPEGHPALGDVDTRAEPPEVKIPDLKPDDIQYDPKPKAPDVEAPPVIEDVEAPPVIEDVEAPPVIKDKVEAPPVIQDKTDVPVAKRVTREPQTEQMDTSGDINNPIERLDMKDESAYREDIESLIKKSKKAGGKVSRNDIKSIGYLDGTLYDNKKYDFSKSTERRRFVREAEQRLKQGRQQTQKAQEQQRQPVVKVVPEPTKTEPLKLKDALKNVQEQERYKEAGEIKGSRQAASRYDIDYGEQRKQERRDAATREINKVLMKDIPAKSDNEQENNERSQLIHERLNTLAGNMGVEVDANMSIKEKKDVILDKHEESEQEGFKETVKEGMERDKRTSPWLDIEASWESEAKPDKKVPLPPGYRYSKDGAIVKPGESLKQINAINNEIANLRTKPQNADTRAKIESLQQEREDIVNAHNARVIKRTKPDPTKEPSKQGKPTAKEDQLKKEEQTETEKIQSKIDKAKQKYSKIENPTKGQTNYHRRKINKLIEQQADLEREYEVAQDEVAKEKETEVKEETKAQEEGNAVDKMLALQNEERELELKPKTPEIRARLTQIKAERKKLLPQYQKELKAQSQKTQEAKPKVEPEATPEVKPPPLPTAKETESLVPKDAVIYEVITTSTDKYRDVLERGPVPSEANRRWIRQGVSGHSNELEDTGGKNHAFTINPSRRAGQRNQGALTQVGFPGRDKTGRSNFMAHSFVINTKEDLDISPAKIIKQIEFENDWKKYSDVQDHVKEQTKKPTIDNIVNIETPSVISNELAQEIADAILDRKTVQVQIVYDSKNLPSNLDVMIQVSELLPNKEQWETTFSTQHKEGSKKDNSIRVQFLHAEDASSPSSRVKVFNITNEVKSKPEPKPETKVEPKVEPKVEAPEPHTKRTDEFDDFIAITREGEIKDNSGISWDWQVKSGDYGDVVAGVSLKAEFDGFGYVSELWYGDESLQSEIKKSELYNRIRTAIQDNQVAALDESNQIREETKVEPEPPKKTPAQKKKAKKAGKAKVSLTGLNKEIKDTFGTGVKIEKNSDQEIGGFRLKLTRNAEIELAPNASLHISEELIKDNESKDEAELRWLEIITDRTVEKKDKVKEEAAEEAKDDAWDKDLKERMQENEKEAFKLVAQGAKQEAAKKKGTPTSKVKVDSGKVDEWTEQALAAEEWARNELNQSVPEQSDKATLQVPRDFEEAYHDRKTLDDFRKYRFDKRNVDAARKGKAEDISDNSDLVFEALLDHRLIHSRLHKNNYGIMPDATKLIEKRLAKDLKALGKTANNLTEAELNVLRRNIGIELIRRSEPSRRYDHMFFDPKGKRLISKDGSFTLQWEYDPNSVVGRVVEGGPAIGQKTSTPIPFNMGMVIRITPEEFAATNWSDIPPFVKNLFGTPWSKLDAKAQKKFKNEADYQASMFRNMHEALIKSLVPKETELKKQLEQLREGESIRLDAEKKAKAYRRQIPYKVMKSYPDMFKQELKELTQRREEKLGENASMEPSPNLTLEHNEYLFSPLDVKPMRDVPANLQVTEQAVRSFAGGVTIGKTRAGYVVKTPNGEFHVVHVNDIRHLNEMELKRYEGQYTKKQLEAAAKHQPMGVYVRGKGKRKYGITDLGVIYLNGHPDSMADMGTLTEELFHLADVMGFINSADRRKLVKKYSSLDKDFITQSEEIAHALKRMERKDRTFILGGLRKFLRKLMKLFNIDDSVGRVMLDAMKAGTIWETRDDVRAAHINSMLDAKDLFFSPTSNKVKGKTQTAPESDYKDWQARTEQGRIDYENRRIPENDKLNRQAAADQIRGREVDALGEVIDKMRDMEQAGFSAVDMHKAKMLHDVICQWEDTGQHDGNVDFIMLVAKYREAYRRLGTAIARALNARRSPYSTETEAIHATLREAVFMPNSQKVRELQKLLGVKSEELISESAVEGDLMLNPDGGIEGTGTGLAGGNGVPSGAPGTGVGTGTGTGTGTGAGTGTGTGLGTGAAGTMLGTNYKLAIKKLPKSKQQQASQLLADIVKERKDMKDFLRNQGFDVSVKGLQAIAKNPIRARQFMDNVSWKKMHQVDKAFAWLKHIFYNNILSGIRTHITNVTNNMLYRKYRDFERGMGRSLFFSMSDPAAIRESLTGEDYKDWKRMERKLLRSRKNEVGKGVLKEEWAEAINLVNSGYAAAWANTCTTFNTNYSAVDSKRLTKDELDFYRREGITQPIATGPISKALVGAYGVPTKALRAGDEFFRSLALNSLVGVAAAAEARLAVADGKIGSDEIDGYIVKQISNPNSLAWDKAHRLASEFVHQETDGALRTSVIRLIERGGKGVENIVSNWVGDGYAGRIIYNTLDLGLRVFALPFRRTPINLIGKGFARSPFLGLLLNGMHGIGTKNKARREGTNVAFFDGIEGESFASMISTIMMLAMIGAGDDEGDDSIGWKNFGWTGSKPGRDKEEEIHGFREGVRGANTIWIFGHQFNYSNVEPFATMMSMAADIGSELKKGNYDGAAAEMLIASPAHQAQDRSFFKGVDEFRKVVRAAGDEDDSAGAQLNSLFADAIASFAVPNIVRQTVRENKNYVVTKVSDSFTQRLVKSMELPDTVVRMFGGEAVPPVVDAWGGVARNEFRKPFDDSEMSQWSRFIGNMTMPMLKYSGSDEVFIGDEIYVNYNKGKSGKEEKFPRSFCGRPWERTFQHEGNEIKLSETDYAHFQYYAGGIAARLCHKYLPRKRVDNPSDFDIHMVTTLRNKARDYVKSKYLQGKMYEIGIESGAAQTDRDFMKYIHERANVKVKDKDAYERREEFRAYYKDVGN